MRLNHLPVIAGFLIISSALSCAKKLPFELRKMNVLEGTWTADTGDTKSVEIWKQEDDHLLGNGWVIKGNDTLVRKYMKIELDSGRTILTLWLNDYDPDKYMLIATGRNSWTFKNRRMSASTSITYYLRDEKQMIVFTDIEGSIMGKQTGKFVYTK